MAQKVWIKVRSGLARDPRHWRKMGDAVWAFLRMIDRANFEDGIAYDWTDREEAEVIGISEQTMRRWRKKLSDAGYIKCMRRQYGHDILIHKWINPREQGATVINMPQSDQDRSLSDENDQPTYGGTNPQSDHQSDQQTDQQSDHQIIHEVITPTLDSRIRDQGSIVCTPSACPQDESGENQSPFFCEPLIQDVPKSPQEGPERDGQGQEDSQGTRAAKRRTGTRMDARKGKKKPTTDPKSSTREIQQAYEAALGYSVEDWAAGEASAAKKIGQKWTVEQFTEAYRYYKATNQWKDRRLTLRWLVTQLPEYFKAKGNGTLNGTATRGRSAARQTTPTRARPNHASNPANTTRASGTTDKFQQNARALEAITDPAEREREWHRLLNVQ